MRSFDRKWVYTRRRGRLTDAQSRALKTLRDRFCISSVQAIDTTSIGVEIGFGMGAELLNWANAEPQQPLLGVELYEPGVGAVLARLQSDSIDNVTVIERPAQEVLAELEERTLREVRIFFPDPWPKKRHHKRRLIQPEFVQRLARAMADAAILRLATDWAPYASWIRQVFAAEPAFVTVHDSSRPADSDQSWPARGVTKFEARGEKLGHDIHDLVFRRTTRK